MARRNFGELAPASTVRRSGHKTKTNTTVTHTTNGH